MKLSFLSNSNRERIRFRSVAGSLQMVIENANDIRRIPELNTAHWAMTGVQIDSLICEKEFLQFMDDDHNGRIRSDEVKRAIQWLMPLLKDASGLEHGSPTLMINAINDALPLGRDMIRTIRIILANMGTPDADRITLEQLRDEKKLVANSLQNGDGVIPPAAVRDPRLAAFASDVMARIGSTPDITGANGVNPEHLHKYIDAAQSWLDWKREAESKAADILPFGAHTDSLHTEFAALRGEIRQFFLSCKLLSFCTGDNAARVKTDVRTADALSPDSVRDFLEHAQLAAPNPQARLLTGEHINPLRQKALDTFFCHLADERFLSGRDVALTAELWDKLELTFAPFEQWTARKPNTLFDTADRAVVEGFMHDGLPAALEAVMTADQAVARNIELSESIRKLLLFQQYMLEFLNNFVSMPRLFAPMDESMLQVGCLVMDGRLFTLVTLVSNPAEHKAIAKNCNICVMYLNVTTGEPQKVKKLSLAVAVTSGNMRNLFVGKAGVFFTPDGTAWDAKVTDFIQQPVSISEAVVMPFYKLGELVEKQADKFFSARSKSYEKGMENSFQNTAGQLAGTSPNPAAPAQTPAVSGSMMLMGGGLGIAALGSAIAFIAQTVHNLSVWNILAILLGIVVVFGGPFILVSLIKLYRRDLSMFLEANGYALNRKMRLSRKMGRLFTFTPALPKLRTVCPAVIAELLTDQIQESRWTPTQKILAILLSALVLGMAFLLGLRVAAIRFPDAMILYRHIVETVFHAVSALHLF